MKQLCCLFLIFLCVVISAVIPKRQLVDIISSGRDELLLGRYLSNGFMGVEPYMVFNKNGEETVIYKSSDIDVSKIVNMLGINIIERVENGDKICLKGVSKLLSSKNSVVELCIMRDIIMINYKK